MAESTAPWLFSRPSSVQCKSSTNDHLNVSLSVSYLVSEANKSNSAVVAHVASISNSATFTRCWGMAPLDGPLVESPSPMRNTPPGMRTFSPLAATANNSNNNNPLI